MCHCCSLSLSLRSPTRLLGAALIQRQRAAHALRGSAADGPVLDELNILPSEGAQREVEGGVGGSRRWGRAAAGWASEVRSRSMACSPATAHVTIQHAIMRRQAVAACSQMPPSWSAHSRFQCAGCHMDGAATVCRTVSSKANRVQAAVGSRAGAAATKQGWGWVQR